MAPALSIIWSASTVYTSFPLRTSTPTALLPSKMIRLVTQFARTVRLSLCLDSLKYPSAVLNLIPFGLFKGYGPTPVESG